MSPLYVKFFLWFLRTNDYISSILWAGNIDAICVASYSSVSQYKLAKATEANLREAIRIKNNLPLIAPIVFASCSHPFPGAEKAESEIKTKMLEKFKVNYLDAGSITNSINEMMAWRDVMKTKGILPRAIVIVTCELHSKSERILAGMLFPGTNVYLRCNPHELEVEENHPTKDQRFWHLWLKASLMRFMAFKAVSFLPSVLREKALCRLAKIQHAPGDSHRVLATE